MSSITPTIYWAINGTELQFGSSSISGTYSGSFAGSTIFSGGSSRPWNSYKDSITSVNILSNISIGSGAYFFGSLINCEEFKNIGRLDTSNVTSMRYMFYECGYSSTVFTLDLSNFNTSNVTDMKYMFFGCGYNSTNFTLDVSNFNTLNVTDMNNMFRGCGYYSTNFTLDLSNFDTSNVTNMSNMFLYCGCISTSFILDVSNFNTSNVTNMNNMFYGCGQHSVNFTLDLSNFNTSNVTNMNSMFKDCKTLKTIYASETFTTSSVTSSTDMFLDCTSLIGAVPYDSSRTDASMANYITGYFKSFYPLPDDSILFEVRNDGQLISLRQEPSTDSDLYGIEFSTKSDLILNLNREEEVDLELYNLLRDLNMLEDVSVEV